MANKESIGALWVKSGAKGTFLSGFIKIGEKEEQIICFLNDYKKEAKHPDWRVFLSEPRDNQYQPKDNSEIVNNEQKEEINPDDIPF